jgi:hypothetical protein
LGLLQYSVCRPSIQEAADGPSRFCPRRCLLKGCERFFRPSHPRSQYCSDACRREFKKWRSWRSTEQWRRSERGRKCRQAQSRRYRQLIPLPLLAEPPATAAEPTTDPAPAVPASTVADPVPSIPTLSPAEPAPAEACEGQRFAANSENFLVRSCPRPGCYELFRVPTEHSRKRFCCTLCCKALGRVHEREARYQRRRRAGFRPCRRRSRPTPKPRK